MENGYAEDGEATQGQEARLPSPELRKSSARSLTPALLEESLDEKTVAQKVSESGVTQQASDRGAGRPANNLQ